MTEPVLSLSRVPRLEALGIKRAHFPGQLRGFPEPCESRRGQYGEKVVVAGGGGRGPGAGRNFSRKATVSRNFPGGKLQDPTEKVLEFPSLERLGKKSKQQIRLVRDAGGCGLGLETCLRKCTVLVFESRMDDLSRIQAKFNAQASNRDARDRETGGKKTQRAQSRKTRS